VKHKAISTNAKGLAAYTRLIWLLGQPHLSDYLHFVAKKVVGGRDQDPLALTAEWRAANDIYYELEQAETGIAESIDCQPIDAALEPLEAALRANVWFRKSFDSLPTSILKVELDKLIISQTHVESSFTEALGRTLADAPDEAALFRFCLPLDRPMAPVRLQRLTGDRFVFSCASNDFRPHQVRVFTPDELVGFESTGPVAGMVGMMVGFGSNFMSAIRSNGRLVLQNGYHRAFTLRSLGFTHAYCIVEEVTRKDELKLTADEDIVTDPAFYFAARRPPMLQDFFDPRLRKELEVLPTETQIEVEIQVRKATATEL
jgi:hypothetical protein